MTSQPKASSKSGGAQNRDQVIRNIYDHYMTQTPQRTKLIDVFMAFLVAVGGIQFLYCVVAGNYVRQFSSTCVSVMDLITRGTKR